MSTVCDLSEITNEGVDVETGVEVERSTEFRTPNPRFRIDVEKYTELNKSFEELSDIDLASLLFVRFQTAHPELICHTLRMYKSLVNPGYVHRPHATHDESREQTSSNYRGRGAFRGSRGRVSMPGEHVQAVRTRGSNVRGRGGMSTGTSTGTGE